MSPNMLRRWVLVLVWVSPSGCVALSGRVGPELEIETEEVKRERPISREKRDGKKTLAYWKALGDILRKEREYRAPEPASAQEAVTWVIEQQLAEIDRLMVLGVDDEALELTARLGDLFRRTRRGVEAVCWYHGLGWPLPIEFAGLGKRAEKLRAEMKAVRVMLSQKYELEFPLLDFPSP